MISPFVSDELIPVTVKYVEKKMAGGLKALVVVRDKETELRYKDNVQEVQTQWKQPNWKESNEILRQSMRFEPESGDRSLDWYRYRSLLLENYMQAWNVQDGEGKTVPCTASNISKLDANIASALVDNFLTRTTPTEQQLGE